MAANNQLTGNDYLSTPIQDLVIHPDFSNEAMTVIIRIGAMTTDQLEQLFEYVINMKGTE